MNSLICEPETIEKYRKIQLFLIEYIRKLPNYARQDEDLRALEKSLAIFETAALAGLITPINPITADDSVTHRLEIK
jgi:hypothetical protein